MADVVLEEIFEGNNVESNLKEITEEEYNQLVDVDLGDDLDNDLAEFYMIEKGKENPGIVVETSPASEKLYNILIAASSVASSAASTAVETMTSETAKENYWKALNLVKDATVTGAVYTGKASWFLGKNLFSITQYAWNWYQGADSQIKKAIDNLPEGQVDIYLEMLKKGMMTPEEVMEKIKN